jgi:hypothetical protein
MKDFVKYGRARHQIYSYKVGVRQHHEGIPPGRRTPELVQLMDMVETLVDAVALALEAGEIAVMQIDLYRAVRLPGLEEDGEEMKDPGY